ncbi:MAG TPA: SDR family NAD(P)-dependent oxidoreductase [Microlunatus sp.]
MSMRFVITGARRGIGRLVADQLVASGHQVWAVVRPGGRIDDLELAGQLECDLAEPDSIADGIDELTGPAEPIDGFVHCAGVIGSGLLAESDPADFEQVFGVNVGSAAQIIRCLLPQLRAAGGTVVLVNSTSGLSAGPPLSVYGSSKYALRGLADALRAEEPRLRVTSVYPSRTATDMQRELRELEQAEYVEDDYLRPETVAQTIVYALLLPPDGVITDLALRPRPR